MSKKNKGIFTAFVMELLSTYGKVEMLTFLFNQKNQPDEVGLIIDNNGKKRTYKFHYSDIDTMIYRIAKTRIRKERILEIMEELKSELFKLESTDTLEEPKYGNDREMLDEDKS